MKFNCKDHGKYILAGSLLLLGIYIGSRNIGVPTSTRSEITMRAKNFIRRINRRDYDTCYDAFNASMKDTMPVSALHDMFDQDLDGLGDFERFESSRVYRWEEADISYIGCALKCQYQNGEAKYVVLFDDNFRIAGVFIK